MGKRSEAESAPRVGLKDIAKAAGLSIAAVSMALSNHPDLSDKTKQRVRALSREMGYRRPQRHPYGSSSAPHRFGFLLVGSRLEDEVHLGELHALTSSANGTGIRFEVLAIEDATERVAVTDQALRFAGHLDGVVLSGYVEERLLAELETLGARYIVLGHVMGGPPSGDLRHGQVVCSDEMAMGELATRSLLAAGHRRIAFVCERIPRGLWSDRWLRGYYAALIEARIDPAPELVQVTGQAFSGAGPAVAELLTLADPPTAFVVPDIRVGASLIQAMAAAGHNVALDAVVVSGQEHLLERHHIGGCPWIGYDTAQMAAVAVRQLRQLCHEAMPCMTTVVVPHAAKRLRGGVA